MDGYAYRVMDGVMPIGYGTASAYWIMSKEAKKEKGENGKIAKYLRMCDIFTNFAAKSYN